MDFATTVFFFLTGAFFQVDFFFGEPFFVLVFRRTDFFAEAERRMVFFDLFCFVLAFFLAVIRKVYHRHID